MCNVFSPLKGGGGGGGGGGLTPKTPPLDPPLICSCTRHRTFITNHKGDTGFKKGGGGGEIRVLNHGALTNPLPPPLFMEFWNPQKVPPPTLQPSLDHTAETTILVIHQRKGDLNFFIALILDLTSCFPLMVFHAPCVTEGCTLSVSGQNSLQETVLTT